MLFWFLVAILIGGVILGIRDNWCNLPSWVITGLAGGAVAISLIILLINHVGVDATIASKNIEYKSLVYQHNHDVYDNDNDIGKKELYKEIQDYNSSLASKQKLQDDFWVGIYLPNIYDQFEFIELK